MDCKEIKNWLSDYIDGAMTGEAAGIVERHLDSCPDCREAYEDMNRLVGFMQDMDTIDEPADMVQNVKARLEKAPSLWERTRDLFAAPAFRVPAAAAVLAAVLLVALYVPSGRDTGLIFDEITAPKDMTGREPAAEPPKAPPEIPAAPEEKLAATDEAKGSSVPDVGREELARQVIEIVEEEQGKKGVASTVTGGRSSDVSPARGAIADSPKQVTPEEKADVFAEKRKEEKLSVGEGAPEPEPEDVVVESFDDAEVDVAAVNKAAPMPATVISAEDTISVAETDEQRVLAAVDSVGGEVLQSHFDSEDRLTALEVKIPWDQYVAFLLQLDADRQQSRDRRDWAASEQVTRERRKPTSTTGDVIIIRVEILR